MIETTSGSRKVTGATLKTIINNLAQTKAGSAADGVEAMVADEFNANNTYSVGDYVIYNGKLYKFTTAHETGAFDGNDAVEVNIADEMVSDVKVNGTSVVSNGAAKIPVASTNGQLGVVSLNGNNGINAQNGVLRIVTASAATIKNGTNIYVPITASNQHNSTFYGLAKAAGDTTQSASSNAVGTYTDEAKAAIQTMLDVPSNDDVIGDVQINGTSVVTNGVANIPIAGTSTFGVIKITSGRGIELNTQNQLQIVGADVATIKAGTDLRKPITPNNVHTSVFYGLTKAAGIDMSNSNNAVGTYTDEAKAAIKSMLGIEDVGSCVQNITGTSVTITGQPNTRYVCGEVLSISITPPSVGTIDVMFTSGSTVAVLTLPNTVKMPEWWEGVEANYTYELVITDGVYAGVSSWPI